MIMTNRFDDRHTNKARPAADRVQQDQSGGTGRQQGGFPHEDGGWGQAEQDLIRDDDVQSQPGGHRDELMDKANQRKPRGTET